VIENIASKNVFFLLFKFFSPLHFNRCWNLN